jgi:hypothetical protein
MIKLYDVLNLFHQRRYNLSTVPSISEIRNTTLRPRWLNIARFSWLLMTIIAVLAFIASIIIAYDEPLLSCSSDEALCGPWTLSREDLALAEQLGLPANAMKLLYGFAFLIPKVAFLAVGLFIFIVRSDDWMALLLSLMLTLFLLEGVSNLGSFQFLAGILYMLVTLLFLLLPFIFPNGRFAPGWIIWPLVPFFLAGSAVSFVTSFSLPMNDQLYGALNLSVFGIWFLLAGYSIIYRYRRVSTAVEKQQTKWVMAGILGTFIGFIPLSVITAFFPPSEPSAERLVFFFFVAYPTTIITYLFMPTGIAFAILRYKLWEIDFIIRKTLVYALLTAALGLIYFGVVVSLQGVVGLAAGDQSPLVIVFSTLVIAALFSPLRRRIQDFIDRRFYRRRYDAGQTLAQFAQTARDEVEIGKLTAELVGVVEQAMQPNKIDIWLKPTEHIK